MKIKNKLRLGFGFLFFAVLLFGSISLYHIQKIVDISQVIQKNNYNTLSYTQNMRTILDEGSLPLSPSEIVHFNNEIVKQEHNISEHGEAKATHQLKLYVAKLALSQADKLTLQEAELSVRRQLRVIENLNMQAIVKRDSSAHVFVKNAIDSLSIVGAFTLLVLFSFSVNFPSVIADPLKDLLEGIHEIGQKNYSQRLNYTQNDEFDELAGAFNTMAAKLNEWENSNLAEVVSEKRRIEIIIEQIEDAIIGISETQQILFINDAARKLFNLPSGKIVGQQVQQLKHGNGLLTEVLYGSVEQKNLKAIANGHDVHFKLTRREIKVPNLNSDSYDVIHTAGRSAGMIYILQNVTEFKKRDEAKINFIATISHELKTPIASIKMSLKLLQDHRIGMLNDEQRGLLGHIREDNSRLLKITSELLNLSQAETGNIQLNFVSVKPVVIVDYALKSISFQAEQKRVELNFNRDESLSEVYADVEKTAWVMVNLLSNALRYSPENSKVIIQLKECRRQIEFSVHDSGRGIDLQYQKHLFDRYFQIPADNQNKAGSGLGLAISRDFIEAQDGRIWVNSTVGEGSTFSFSLPIA